MTVDGRTLTGAHFLITTRKHGMMFVAGVESSVKRFRVREALLNPGRGGNKAQIAPAPATNAVI